VGAMRRRLRQMKKEEKNNTQLLASDYLRVTKKEKHASTIAVHEVENSELGRLLRDCGYERGGAFA